jgi:membrane protein implicated in regulation of membrane protease activity
MFLMLIVIFMPLLMLVLMLLPLIALPVFWLLPLAQAIPLYALSVLVAGAMFWFMRESMKQRAVTGAEGLIGRDAKVVSQSRSSNEQAYVVEVKGELWTATSADAVTVGETVRITAMDGIRLIVKRKETDKAKAKPEG